MIILQCVETVVVLLYCSLNVYTSYLGLCGNSTNAWANYMMIISSLVVFFVIVLIILNKNNLDYFLFISLILIQIASINNDVMVYKEISFRSQLLRIIIATIIIVLYFKIT
ncbi:MAG: hypothetical protein E6929_07910 [Clostridium sp.]|nr:hypothetical protein [Clostridium sp.]